MRGAIDELRAGGHVLDAAEVLGMLSRNRWVAGETDTAYALVDEALALAEAQPPGRTLAQLYASRAGRLAIGGRDAEALEYAEKALSLLEDAPLDAITSRSLQVRGIARCGGGDLGGLDDLREALRRAQEAGLGLEHALAYTNLACWTWLAEGPQAGLELYRAGLDFARRRGLTGNFGWASAETTWCLYDSGDWDELLQVSDDVLELEQELGRAQPGTMVRTSAALVALQRGRLDEARALIDESLPRARAARDPQVLVPALGAAALLASTTGDDAAAASLVAELPEVAAFYPATGRACIRAGRSDLVERLLSDGIPAGRREELGFATLRALLAEADGELELAAALFEAAAAGWETYGHRLERAGCLVGRGRCLLGLRRRAEAAAALEQARAVFAALGATVPAAEADELLAEAFRLTS